MSQPGSASRASQRLLHRRCSRTCRRRCGSASCCCRRCCLPIVATEIPRYFVVPYQLFPLWPTANFELMLTLFSTDRRAADRAEAASHLQCSRCADRRASSAASRGCWSGPCSSSSTTCCWRRCACCSIRSSCSPRCADGAAAGSRRSGTMARLAGSKPSAATARTCCSPCCGSSRSSMRALRSHGGCRPSSPACCWPCRCRCGGATPRAANGCCGWACCKFPKSTRNPQCCGARGVMPNVRVTA